MNEFKKPIYPNLEVELTLVSWSYSDLAKYLNLSVNAVSERMRGVTEFKLTEVIKVAKLFNKSVEYLFLKSDCE